MTLPRYTAMVKYWENAPPLHLMVAAYFGIGSKKAKREHTTAEIAEAMALSAGLNKGAT